MASRFNSRACTKWGPEFPERHDLSSLRPLGTVGEIVYTKPGSATRPLQGIDAAGLDEASGEDAGTDQGLLVLRRPWPGTLRMLYKDEDRFIETYSDKVGLDTYTVGDAARRDEDGYSGSSGALEEKVSERQSEDEE